MTNRQYRRCRVTAQSTWKKSVASIVDACVCRNVRHVVSERRSGAGGVLLARCRRARPGASLARCAAPLPAPRRRKDLGEPHGPEFADREHVAECGARRSSALHGDPPGGFAGRLMPRSQRPLRPA